MLRFVVINLALALGFFSGWRIIKGARRHSSCDNALLCWKEEPVSSWREDRTLALFIALHMCSVIALGALFVLDATWRGTQPTLFLLDATPFMPPEMLREFQDELAILVTAGLGIVCYICGGLLAFPVARHFIRPLQHAIMAEGVVSGPNLYLWDRFSHFVSQTNPDSIRVYSRRAPEILMLYFEPADTTVLDKAAALLREHLLSSAPQPASWLRHGKVRLGVLLLAVTMPFVAAGLWIYALELGWSWIYYTFVTPLVVFLGQLIFRQVT